VLVVSSATYVRQSSGDLSRIFFTVWDPFPGLQGAPKLITSSDYDLHAESHRSPSRTFGLCIGLELLGFETPQLQMLVFE